MSLVFDPSATTPAPAGSPVYAFNTDSMAGLSMANQLLSQGATVSRGAAAFDSGGVHFTTGAALVDGTSIPLATLNADSAQWGTPVYGLSSLPGQPLCAAAPEDRGLHRRHDRADEPDLPRDR